MSFWDIFKSSKNKPDNGALSLRMADKKYPVVPVKPKLKGFKPVVVSVADRRFQVMATFDKTTKQADNLGRVVCHRLMCLETGRMFTLEKEIFDRLFTSY